MGIYYAAVDFNRKQRIEPPNKNSIKSPGIFHPFNPFPNMVVMKNHQGYDFEICDDVGTDYYSGIEDITEQVYEEFLAVFPWAKEHYED